MHLWSGLHPEPHLGSCLLPDPLAGGEGITAPSPRTAPALGLWPQISALRASTVPSSQTNFWLRLWNVDRYWRRNLAYKSLEAVEVTFYYIELYYIVLYCIHILYTGHFLLTHLLLDKLKASPSGSRVINVMANAYRLGEVVLDDLQFESREYKPGEAYAQSKLAVLLFTRRLCRQLESMCHLVWNPEQIVVILWWRDSLVVSVLD